MSAAVALSFNQVISRLKQLALSHKQIRSFYYYDIVDTLTVNKQVMYPAFFIDHAVGNISKEDKQATYTFKIYIADLINVAQDAVRNYDDTESDLHQIAQDYFAMCHSELFDDWVISPSINTEYFEEKFEDMVGAVYFEMQVAVHYFANRCSVPDTKPLLFTEQNPT